MFLPALPAMRNAFSTDAAVLQWALSGFMLGFCFSQIFWGVIGDRFGRRMPAFIGLGVFIAASIGCAMSTTVELFLFFRLIQSFGAAATPVLTRAMVTDVYPRAEAASVFSLMMLVLLTAPLVAPLIGGNIVQFADWSVIFYVLGGLGVLGLVLMMRLPETLDPRHRRSIQPGAVAQTFIELAARRRFVGFALGGGFAMSGVFAFISGSSYLLIETFDLSPRMFGALFGVNVINMMVGNVVNSRIVKHRGIHGMLVPAMCGIGLSSLAMVCLHLFGTGSLIEFMIPMGSYFFFVGLITGNTTAGAMAEAGPAAGSASGFLGLCSMGLGALAGLLVAATQDGTAWPMIMTIAISAVGSATCYFGLTRGGSATSSQA